MVETTTPIKNEIEKEEQYEAKNLYAIRPIGNDLIPIIVMSKELYSRLLKENKTKELAEAEKQYMDFEEVKAILADMLMERSEQIEKASEHEIMGAIYKTNGEMNELAVQSILDLESHAII